MIELQVHYAGHDWTLVSAVVLPLGEIGGNRATDYAPRAQHCRGAHRSLTRFRGLARPAIRAAARTRTTTSAANHGRCRACALTKKRVARRPQQPDQSAQAAQLKLDSKLESQAYLLAKNAEGQRPVTKQAQAAIDQRKTTSKAHASDAKRTAVSLHLCPESVASALDAARVARLSDAPDKQRLTPAKRKHDGDYNIRPQN